MSRPIRFLPRPNMLVEVTCRTIQSRFLLRPGKQLNEVFVGCLGKAQELYPVPIHGVVVVSNHYHLLLSPADAEQLACFMRHLNTNLSKEVGRIHDWSGTVFNRRYRAIPVSDEPEVQVSRLRYLLSHGAKEGLVYSPAAWPGVHSVDALLMGKPLRGRWHDRTLEFAARQKGDSCRPNDFSTVLEIELEPPPCWQDLAEETRRERVRLLVAVIEKEALKLHGERGTEPAGARAVRRMDPHHRPVQSKKAPAPSFHAWTREQRRRLKLAYAEFLVAYRVAAERLFAGARNVLFPEGSFPPAMPFVRSIESFAPV